ncbi:uncharacterized mitochondrial protein AtMg00810-like [Lathyrus oleraceus]|uniref:uncharacterized mitochondrial protein AtMg00810-like n=1 Tax=Pisum sativum TaxID=3888 RepID=UPI0021CEC5D8|nr:uncharacterized mitochondrial protein AtMg00810-like [Pisum sativum]
MEYGVYLQHTSEGSVILVCLYMDGILLIGSCTSEVNKFKKVMMNAFDMTDLGNIVYYLGMKILHSEKGIVVHQLKYEFELLKRFELIICKSTVTPAEITHKLDYDDDGEDVDVINFEHFVGCLRYLYSTRPDICYTFGMMSRFMSKPNWSHYQALIRIMKHVKGTLRYGILFPYGVSYTAELICYSDSGWCGDSGQKKHCMILLV